MIAGGTTAVCVLWWCATLDDTALLLAGLNGAFFTGRMTKE